jgi:hypothetical protein
VLVVALSSPLLVGVYADDELIKTYETSSPASESLPKIFGSILRDYAPAELFYANGPGSFMAIKASFVYLRTLSIALDIPLMAADGFAFNANSPIKSLGNQWFFKQQDGIVLGTNPDNATKPFALPSHLERAIFSHDNAPFYVLGAI